jgi:hypothetical protein
MPTSHRIRALKMGQGPAAIAAEPRRHALGIKEGLKSAVVALVGEHHALGLAVLAEKDLFALVLGLRNKVADADQAPDSLRD